MDDFTAELFATRDEPSQSSDHDDTQQLDADLPKTPKTKSLRGRVAALRDKATIQDHLLDKSVSSMLHAPVMPS